MGSAIAIIVLTVALFASGVLRALAHLASPKGRNTAPRGARPVPGGRNARPRPPAAPAPPSTAEGDRREIRRLARRLSLLEKALEAGAGSLPADRTSRPDIVKQRLAALSERGASPDEIALALDLSRGEVELMLKLHHRGAGTESGKRL